MPRTRRLSPAERIAARQTAAEKAGRGEMRYPEGFAELRKAVGMNQESFAKMVGLHRSQIADLERGAANPTVETLNQILKPFGMEIGIVKKR